MTGSLLTARGCLCPDHEVRRQGKLGVAGAADKDQTGDISLLTLSTNLGTLHLALETGELYDGTKIRVIRIIV